MAAEANSISLNAALDAAAGGPDHVVNFIRVLARSRVHVITDRPWNGRAVPEKDMRLMLVSDGENVQQAMLAVFTDATHASECLDSLAGIQHAFTHKVEVDMAWALLGVPENSGIMVNPNSGRAFRIAPDICKQLRRTAELSYSFAATQANLRREGVTNLATSRASAYPEIERRLSQMEDELLAGNLEKAKALLPGIPDTPENAHFVLCARAMLANARGEQDLAIRLTHEAIGKNADPRIAGKLWSQLAKYLVASKKLQQAEDAYVLACSSDPSQVQYALDLASLLADQYRNNDAITLLEKSISVHPSDSRPALQLGNLLFTIGREAQALEAFDKVVALDPDNGGVHLNRAICLQTIGRLDESRVAFERALRQDPDLDGYNQYVQTRKFSRENVEENAPLLELLEKRGGPEMSMSSRIDSNFALAKVYDSMGDLDTSFKYLELANKLKRSALTYSSDDTRQTMEEIKSLFSKDFIERFRGKGALDAAPIFVLGMPRSGTTLTEQILAAHSRVNPGNELTFLSNMGSEFTGVWKRRILDGKDHDADITNDLRRLGETYLERTSWLQIPGKRFTDKMPGNFMQIGLIYLVFPNASVIHCHRHPADTCLSCYERLFSKGLVFSYDQHDLGVYYKLYLDLMQHWREVLPKDFILEMKYEDTVADPENRIRRLLDFCKLDFEADCLEFHKVKRTVTTASSLQVRQPMYKSSLQRWKKYGAKLQPLLDALGPELVGPVD